MLLLGSIVFVVSLGYGAGLPLMQPYLAQFLGAAKSPADARHIGMLGIAYTFALFLFAPMWGRLSGRHGRNRILVAGLTTFLLGGLATALAPNLAVVYGARLLAGAGAAAIVPTAQAFIANIGTPEARSRRFVILGSAAFTGFLAGPPFGTWIAVPIMGTPVEQIAGTVNRSTLAILLGGHPLLLLIRWGLGPAPAVFAHAPRTAKHCSAATFRARLDGLGTACVNCPGHG